MWYKTVKHEKGKYQNEEGERFMLCECHGASAPNGKKNAALGLTEFKNREECLKTWKLIEYKEQKKNEVQDNEPKQDNQEGQ